DRHLSSRPKSGTPPARVRALMAPGTAFQRSPLRHAFCYRTPRVPGKETTMIKKAQSTGKAKGSRKRSTATDLAAKNARSVKGGTRPTPAQSINFEKFKYEYKEQQ